MVDRNELTCGMLGVISIVVAMSGLVFLVVDLIEMQRDAALITEADGRDLCVLFDGKGDKLSRAFVEMGEPCPLATDDWHTVERTSYSDLNQFIMPSPVSVVLLLGGFTGFVTLFLPLLMRNE